MIGRVYTARGFDRYGNFELEPKRMNTVWVEPEFLQLRAKKKDEAQTQVDLSPSSAQCLRDIYSIALAL